MDGILQVLKSSKKMNLFFAIFKKLEQNEFNFLKS